MAMESAVATQLLLLCQQHPGMVWELVQAPGPVRAGDVVLRSGDGVVLAYARPVVDDPVSR
jgi:hypothetical protein